MHDLPETTRDERRPLPDEAGLGGHIGPYRILRTLDRGGMGTVYLAERDDGVYRQQVALKVVQTSALGKRSEQRFRVERQILASLSHPGIARLLDGGLTPAGLPYLVLEYVDGRPVDRFCEEEKLSVRQRLSLFLRIAAAVQAAHQQLVLHLDLKPANILVAADGEPRLLDFGIARLLNSDAANLQTQLSLVLATPHYASPEQVSGDAVTVASDVFSLCTLLYRMLTGVLPYPVEDTSPLETARILRDTPALQPSKAVAASEARVFRGDLDTILLKGLRKEPERRYSTVEALADDIERYLGSRPVLAHGDSLRYRAAKFMRRHRVALVAAAVLCVVLAGSVTAVVRAAVVARHEQDNANRRLKDVRELAHSYIFDLDKMLRDIPGTIHVRAKVLQSANHYLEAMSREKTNDEDLLRELGEGYSAIGRVQSVPGQPSLSDPAGAALSQAKAIAIERRLLAKHPENLDDRVRLVNLLLNLAQVYEASNDLPKRLELDNEAWQIAQPVLQAGPGVKGYVTVSGVPLMQALVRCGSGDDWTLADPAGALPWVDRAQNMLDAWRKTHSEKEPRTVIQNQQAIMFARATSLRQMEQPAEMRSVFEAALQLPVSGGNGRTEDLRHRVIRYSYVAALLDLGDSAAAKKFLLSTSAIGVHEKGSDSIQQSSDADMLLMSGRIDLREGRVMEGSRAVHTALAEQEKLVAADPDDSVLGAGLAFTLLRLANENALPSAERKAYFQRARASALAFLAKQPQAMSAAIVAGKCSLGLARIAAQEQDRTSTREYAGNAAASFLSVLAVHPVQPEAAHLLAQANLLRAE